MATTPRFVNVFQLCAELKLPRAWVRRMARNGVIPHLRVSGQMLFDIDQVSEVLLKRAESEAAGAAKQVALEAGDLR